MNNKKFFLAKMLLILTCSLLTLPAIAAKSKISENIGSQSGKVFVFSPRSLTWAIYNSNGNLVRSGHAVGGRNYCPDVGRSCRTPTGTYRIYHKEGPYFRSSRYPAPRGGAPMPYAMFFYRGFAIHGSNDVPNYNASHGCIRVYPADARWMSQNFLPIGSKVVIKSY